MILLSCAAALRLVNSFDSRLINLLFGLPVLLIFKDDHRKKAFLLLIGGAVILFSELVIELFLAKIPLWQLIMEELPYTREAEKYMMGTLSYILCWFVLHGLKICFLGTQYKMREHFLVMEVENTCISTPAAHGKVKHILPASTKPDAGNHGFGIANVRDTAQKYGGLLYIEQNGDRFTAILTIAKSCLARRNGTVEK